MFATNLRVGNAALNNGGSVALLPFHRWGDRDWYRPNTIIMPKVDAISMRCHD